MEKGIEVYCGSGRGKTTLAIGQSIRSCSHGKSVIVIQFLKGKERGELNFLEDLDGVDIKMFSFEKSDKSYEELSEQEQREQKVNILNGLNFARKVIVTQECDVLVLDEILRLFDYGITTPEEVKEILKAKDSDMEIILTGRNMCKELEDCVDQVTTLETVDLNKKA